MGRQVLIRGMVSDKTTTPLWYILTRRSGIGDSEGNAKRVMLFGTALLTTIDILIKRSLFKSEGSDVRNLALILGHFLNFVHDMKEMCKANEDGWKKIVLERADEHGIEPYMISIDHAISEIRDGDIRDSNDDANSDISNEDGTPRPTIATKKECIENAAKSYESKPWVGLITLESLKAGVKRSWTYWNWASEVYPFTPALRLSHGSPLTLPVAFGIFQSTSCQSWAMGTDLWEKDRWQIL